MKRALRWIYDWATVLTATIMGAPQILIALINALDDINLTPLVGPERSLQIITVVAIVKAVLSLIEARRA
jgi:hypothetical protein